MKKIVAYSLFLILVVSACKETNNKDEKKAAEPTILNTEGILKETSKSKKIKEFSWDDVTESTVDIGVFPYIQPPEEMMIDKYSSDTQSFDFYKLEMFDGTAFFNVAGRVDKMGISMKDVNNKKWNQYLFDSSVSKYLESIGAILIADKKIPNDLINTWGDSPNEKYEHMHKFYVGDVVNDIVKMYVLKTPHVKVAFQIYSNSAMGNIGVVEIKDFKQTIKKVTADEILDAINTKGVATLYINFDTGKSRIKTESYTVIDEIVKMMEANPNLKISVEGHTDNIGDEVSNMALSKNRAEAVLKAITNKTINKTRLSSTGLGATKPIEDNTTKEGRAKNRRVELRKL